MTGVARRRTYGPISLAVGKSWVERENNKSRGQCGHTSKEDAVSSGQLCIASGGDGRDVMADALDCEDAAFTPDFPAAVAFCSRSLSSARLPLFLSQCD